MTDESIFAEALAIGSPAERAAYLDRACAGNPALRAEVQALLDAHAASNPLDQPPADVARTGAYEPARAESPDEAIGSVLAGKYKLIELIGAGGMGAVYKAQQTEPVKRLVAVKVIRDGMDTRQVLARFEAERQALALMDHPNIAKVLDAGTTDRGQPFFVMELVKGVPITEFCDARKLSPRERLELFVPVCQAIQHAHQKGVIHRDIKPSNVLVALYDGRPVPKVIDFGVAKAAGQPLTDKTLVTGFGAIVGTPEYMSPEQAELNQLDIDTRSDVFALGVLLYELLTGTTPLNRSQLGKAALLEVLRIVREVEPPKPSTRVSTSGTLANIAANRNTDPVKLSKLMKGELDWIVMKALEKDRNRRYESATALAKDVERHLRGDAVEACPPTLGYRVRKAYRRNRAAVLVTAAFAGVICGAAVVGGFLAVQAKRAETVAIEERDRAQVAFETEQRARRRFRAVYRTSSIDLFRTAFTIDRNGIELLAFQNDSWKVIRIIRTLTDPYLAETGSSSAARAVRAEGFMWKGVDLYGEQHYAEAIDAFREAEAIFRTLTEGGQTRDDARADLAGCRMVAAFAALSAKRRPEADQLASLAEQTARELVAERSENPEYRYELALILWQLPTLRGMAGDAVEEAPQLREARALLEQLVRDAPGALHYRTGLANILLALALERKRSEPTGALALYAEALSVLEHLPADQVREPVPMLRKWAHRARGRLLTELGRHGEAVRDWERVVNEAPEPLINPNDRSELAVATARAGDLPRAIAEAERVSRSSTFSSSYKNAACAFALVAADPKTPIADREKWAARAVTELRRCVDYYTSTADYTEPPFDTLKGRADHQALLDEVRRKSKAAKAP